MTLDPRWNFWLSVGLAVLAFLSGAGTQLSGLGLTPKAVTAVLSGITLLLGIGNAVNAVLAAIPSAAGQTKGFYLGPKEPPKQ